MEREGKGIGTASLRKEQEALEETEKEKRVDGVEVDGDDDDDGVDDDGVEKMMCESDGVGYKSMPKSLAMVASLYVFVMISFVGRNKRHGILDLLLLLLLLLISWWGIWDVASSSSSSLSSSISSSWVWAWC